MPYSLPPAPQVIDLFQPRQDSFAVWKSGHPVPERANGQDLGLSLNHIEAHLRGDSLIGIYSTNRDDTCTWAAIDIDNFETATDDAKDIMDALQQAGFGPLLERSKSGEGYHVWLLLNGPIAAFKLRLLLMDIIRKAGINTSGKLKAEKAFDRIFPNQDSINGGYGNLIALPFWGQAVSKGNSLFIDPATLIPYPDQLGFLQNAARMTEEQLDRYIQDHKLSKASTLAANRKAEKYSSGKLGQIADIQHCEYIRYCDDHRTDLPEPLWYALAANLAPFGKDGRDLFHALSEGHQKYTEKEADYKFTNAAKVIEQGKHPISCKRLEQEGFVCPLLNQCRAKFVANYPSMFADIPMTLTEMQQHTHAITIQNDTSSDFRRFARGYQQLDDSDQEEIINQVSDVAGLTDKDRKEFVKKLNSVKPATIKETRYLPLIRDYYRNAPGHEELVLPRGYTYKNHKLYTIHSNRKGDIDEEVIADQVLIITELGHDYDRGEAATRTLAFRNVLGEWEQLQVQRADSSDGKSLHKALGNVSFAMSSDQGPSIAKYLKDFEVTNSLLLLPKLTTARLGWMRIHNEWEYIPYSTAATLVPKGSGDRVLTRHETFAEKGTAAEWLKLFELLQQAPIATFVLTAALTPTLYPALGGEAQSHTITISGKSGTGKSAIQKIASTIYGIESALLHNWNSTTVGLEQSLAMRTHMPAMYEDLQNATDKHVNSLVYQVFNGLGRERGAKEGGTRKTAEFATILIASAEADIRDKAQYAGFLRRGLVVTDPVFGNQPEASISNFVSQLDRIAKANRGSLGRDWVARVKAEILEQVAVEQVAERVGYWAKALQAMASQGIDATLARLMAQHLVTEEMLERWYAINNVVERLKSVWLGIAQDTKAHDINRKYMTQVLEWAASESNTNGTFGAVGTRKREGILTDEYAAVFLHALEQYLRKINNQPEINGSVILEEWANRGWIQQEGGKNTVKVSVDGHRIRMVKILLNAKDLPEVIEYTPVVKVEGDKGTVVRMPGA